MVMAMIEDITRLSKWAHNLRLGLVLGAGGHPVSVVALAGVLALSGCVSAGPTSGQARAAAGTQTQHAGADVAARPAREVEATWEKRMQVEPKGIAGPVPVVVFLHGCSGLAARPELKEDTQSWAETVTRAGWRFVAPDSWARQGRPDACRPDLKTALTVHRMRLAEIAYAMEQLAGDPAVDRSRIVIFGNSEGGIAAAKTEPHGARGVIIAGWTCHSRAPEGVGITAPADVAILALEFERDSFLPSSSIGRCSVFFPGRSTATEVIVPGSGHLLGQAQEARQAVKAFLDGVR